MGKKTKTGKTETPRKKVPGVVLLERPPTVSEYRRLRESVGWGDLDATATKTALGNALFSVCAVTRAGVVGCGRVIGDGGVYFYIQDIIVSPGHQGRGIGRRLMDSVMRYLGRCACEGAFVGLMAAKGAAGLYEKYGFQRRPEDSPGMFLRLTHL